MAQGGVGAEVVCLDPEACYTINLYDSYGDGWNGATLVLGDFEPVTLSAGAFDTYTVGDCAAATCDAELIDVSWTNPSMHDVNFLITLPSGDFVAAGGSDFNGTICADPNLCYDVYLSRESWGTGVIDSTLVLHIGEESIFWDFNSAWPGINVNSSSASYLPFAFGDCSNVGCTDPEACNYESDATVDDGSCSQLDECGVCGGDNSECTGCTDPEACNYDPDAIFEQPSLCSYPPLPSIDCDGNFVEGCMYDAAINYNPYAVIEDGSCEFYPSECLAYGCTYMGACNYDAQADCDDGSCVFAAEGFDCAGNELGDDTDACGPGTHWDDDLNHCVVTLPMDGNFDGCVSMSDLLDLLSSFGTCLD